jgi:hypothetical protein
MNAGWSSSSSASPDCPSLFEENRGGRLRSRLCIGGSESEDGEEELSSGDDKGAGRGERVIGSMAKEFGRDLGFGWGERERRFSVACVGRGLVGAKLRVVTVVFADDVRENGGAVEVSLQAFFGDIGASPVGRPGVPGTLGSFLGIGESLREDRADATRGTALCEFPCRYKSLFD